MARSLALATFSLALGAPGAAGADGLLPGLPYRYLHPPASLSGTNEPPLSGLRILPVDYMRAVSWSAFTDDGQAGISGRRNLFVVNRSTSAVLIRIEPVTAPSGLPSGLSADGNAYRTEARSQPANNPLVTRRSFDVVLRYPVRPLGLYEYREGVWREACSSRRAIVTSTTFTCRVPALGTFVLAHRGSQALPGQSPSPIDAWSHRAAAALIALAALALGYSALRSRGRVAQQRKDLRG